MAFGMFSPDPNDSYDTGRTVGLGAQKRAQDFLNNYIETDIVGGAGVDTFGQMRYKEILGDAQQSANQTAQGAKTFGDIASFAGGLGSFGASGGFNTLGKTIGVDRASAGMGISGSVAPKTGLEYFGPAF